jgi:hypothetical protein
MTSEVQVFNQSARLQPIAELSQTQSNQTKLPAIGDKQIVATLNEGMQRHSKFIAARIFAESE